MYDFNWIFFSYQARKFRNLLHYQKWLCIRVTLLQYLAIRFKKLLRRVRPLPVIRVVALILSYEIVKLLIHRYILLLRVSTICLNDEIDQER